ncbi:MAG: TolC family protein [Cytophagales bacterium]|nr:TolC family protein [Cytophagales bacterium]
MKTLRKLFLNASLLLGAAGAMAQSQAQGNDNVWSLRECIEYSMNNNLTIKRSELQSRNSEVAYFQSKMAFLPTVNGNGQLSWNFGRFIDPTTNQFINQNTQTGNFGLSGGVLLFQGGQQLNTYKQNEKSFRASVEDIRQSRYDVSLNVAVNYLAVLQNQELLIVAQNQADISRAQVERTEKLVQAGSLPQTNLFDLQAQYANDQLSVTNALNNVRLAKLNLMQSMNLPAQDNFEVEKIELDDPDINPYDKTAAQIYDIALASQPNVKAADLRVQSSIYGVRASKGFLFPRITFGGGLNTFYSDARSKFNVVNNNVDPSNVIGFLGGDNRQPVLRTPTPLVTVTPENYPFGSQLRDNLGQFLGFSLSVPILNGWQTRTTISRSIVQNNISQLDAQNIRVQLRQNIEQAYLNLQAAASQYQANKQQVAAQQLSFQANETRFNVGLANSVDYNTAKNNLARAQANLVNSKYTYYFRVKILDFYQNKPLIE